MTEPNDVVGQVSSETSQESTQAAPENETGQSVATEQTTSGSGSEQTFFDPSNLPEDLMPAYKQMQGAWTKKMQEASKSQSKIEAYNHFAKDPVSAMHQFAQQYGYNLVQGAPQEKDWEPKTWDDVLTKAEQVATEKVMAQLQPVLSQVKEIKRSSIEQQLTEIDPQWRMYEDKMKENLNVHQSLVNDPESLYRISVPQEVYQSRAYQKAVKDLKTKASEGQLSGGSKTNKQPSSKPSGKLTFDQAVEAAKAQLAADGMRPGV